jgi:hypothetical protein
MSEKSFFENLRDKAADSAVDFALNAFWVAVWGAVVTGLLALWAMRIDIPATWVYALGGAFTAFVVVALATGGLVWYRRGRVVAVKPARKGYLNFKVEALRAMTANNKHIGEIGDETARIGKMMGAGARKIEKINANGRDVDERAYKLARKTAAKLLKRVRKMELHIERFSVDTDAWISNFTSWFRWAEKENLLDKLAGMKPALTSLLTNVRTAKPNTKGFRDSADGIRSMSDDMDFAAGRLVGALDIVLEKMSAAEKFCEDTIGKLP